MNNDMTNCPQCRAKQTVTEYDNLFQCVRCGNWGYSRRCLPFAHDQTECWNQDGQVYRKPRAA